MKFVEVNSVEVNSVLHFKRTLAIYTINKLLVYMMIRGYQIKVNAYIFPTSLNVSSRLSFNEYFWNGCQLMQEHVRTPGLSSDAY